MVKVADSLRRNMIFSQVGVIPAKGTWSSAAVHRHNVGVRQTTWLWWPNDQSQFDYPATLPHCPASCSAPRNDNALSVNVGFAALSVGKIPHPAT